MHTQDFIWQLFSRCLSNEASFEERNLLFEILKNDELLQQRYEILKQFWNASHRYMIVENIETDERIAKILHKANASDNNINVPEKKFRSRRKIVFIAGSFLIITLCAAFLLHNKIPRESLMANAPAKTMQQLVTQNGSRNRTILPDGSIVWLNAGSSLTYSGELKGAMREVYLNGEGFFDVVKQNNRPFIVHANGVDIKVLGTAFDVKSYSEENTVEATLIRGLIQVTRPGNNNPHPFYLHPNEKLVIDLKKDILPQKEENNLPSPLNFKVVHLDSTIKAEEITETAWIYNRLEFRGDNFEQLAKKLERWYNIKIFFKDEAVKHLNFNGSFETETAEQAFAALKAAALFDYSIEGHTIFIKSAFAEKNK